MSTNGREKKLYPLVERYIRRRFECFVSGQNRGTRHGRVDVIGIRDIGGYLNGSFELIGVEVKAGYQPFNIAAGQASGYSVYANRCYLADVRSGPRFFDLEEIDIAGALRIGLLAVTGSKVVQVLAAPPSVPLARLQLELVEKLGYSACSLCGSLFRRSTGRNFTENVSSAGLGKAAEREKGAIFWLFEHAKGRRDPRSYVYHRRYLCADCVRTLHS
jgi:hypothetical protein